MPKKMAKKTSRTTRTRTAPTTGRESLTLAQVLEREGRFVHRRLPYAVSVKAGQPTFEVGCPTLDQGTAGPKVTATGDVILKWTALPERAEYTLPQRGWIEGAASEEWHGQARRPVIEGSSQAAFFDLTRAWQLYYYEGQTMPAVAIEMGVALGTFHRHWKAWNLPARPRARGASARGQTGLTDKQIETVLDSTKTVAELVDATGLSRQRIHQIRAGQRRSTARERGGVR